MQVSSFDENAKEEDEYEKALAAIFGIAVKLSGGYYEPKSERDRLLALELVELLEKHNKEV